MRIENFDQEFDLDIKRLYVGAKVYHECKKCGQEISHDLRDYYISYPTANAVNKIGLYCADCNIETSVKVFLNVTLSIAPEDEF